MEGESGMGKPSEHVSQAKRRRWNWDLAASETDKTMSAANRSDVYYRDTDIGNINDLGTGVNKSGEQGGSFGSDPIPMGLAQHQRAIDKFRLKASGTTFIGQGAAGGGTGNTWFRFPWENIQFFITDWTTFEIGQKWLYWKATGINFQLKNPLCVQEIGSAASGLATAGQNLHAQLFGYMDNLYIMGIDNPVSQLTEATVASLIKSWKNNGYDNGNPIQLPSLDPGDNLSTFQNNWPDVKACGMGAGHQLSYGWNIHSPYWRPTGIFQVSMLRTPGGVNTYDTCNARFDERLGVISGIGSAQVNHAAVPSTNTAINCFNPEANELQRRTWATVDTSGDKFLVPYMDPNPIPGIYFQLQPQLGSISEGVSDSICQVQWELSIDIVCTGRLPRMSNDQLSILDGRNIEAIYQGKENKRCRTVPLFYDVMLETIDYVNP